MDEEKLKTLDKAWLETIFKEFKDSIENTEDLDWLGFNDQGCKCAVNNFSKANAKKTTFTQLKKSTNDDKMVIALVPRDKVQDGFDGTMPIELERSSIFSGTSADDEDKFLFCSVAYIPENLDRFKIDGCFDTKTKNWVGLSDGDVSFNDSCMFIYWGIKRKDINKIEEIISKGRANKEKNTYSRLDAKRNTSIYYKASGKNFPIKFLKYMSF